MFSLVMIQLFSLFVVITGLYLVYSYFISTINSRPFDNTIDDITYDMVFDKDTKFYKTDIGVIIIAEKDLSDIYISEHLVELPTHCVFAFASVMISEDSIYLLKASWNNKTEITEAQMRKIVNESYRKQTGVSDVLMDNAPSTLQ